MCLNHLIIWISRPSPWDSSFIAIICSICTCWGSFIKLIVWPKIKFLSPFIHPQCSKPLWLFFFGGMVNSKCDSCAAIFQVFWSHLISFKRKVHYSLKIFPSSKEYSIIESMSQFMSESLTESTDLFKRIDSKDWFVYKSAILISWICLECVWRFSMNITFIDSVNDAFMMKYFEAFKLHAGCTSTIKRVFIIKLKSSSPHLF